MKGIQYKTNFGRSSQIVPCEQKKTKRKKIKEKWNKKLMDKNRFLKTKKYGTPEEQDTKLVS